MFNNFSMIERPLCIERAVLFPESKEENKNYFNKVTKEAIRLNKTTKNKIVRLYLSYIIEHSENCISEINKDNPELHKYVEYFDNIEWAIGVIKKS